MCGGRLSRTMSPTPIQGEPIMRHAVRHLVTMPRLAAVVAASVLAAAGMAATTLAPPAAAATPTKTSTHSYATAGTYTLTVPNDISTTSKTATVVDLVGGAGFAGDNSALNGSSGGAGGSGTHGHLELGAPNVQPGDVLKIVVGSKGGGGQRGY